MKTVVKSAAKVSLKAGTEASVLVLLSQSNSLNVNETLILCYSLALQRCSTQMRIAQRKKDRKTDVRREQLSRNQKHESDSNIVFFAALQRYQRRDCCSLPTLRFNRWL